MRIAYVINSMEGGGAQTSLPKIVCALEKAGAHVRVLALTRRNGLAIERLRTNGIEAVVRDGGEKDHLTAYRWIHDQAREWAADVIWTSLTRSTLLGQIAGKTLGIPVVSWQHNAFLKPWNERLLRWRADASHIWVADSLQVAVLTKDRLGVAKECLITWPIFAAEPCALKARPWKPGETLQVGSLGRLHPNKGYDILIDALAMMHAERLTPSTPFRIVIGGTGADEAALRARALNKGVERIYFTGFENDTAGFLANLHLYLQPSRREGFCIAAHEAMQAGLPVIVSRTGEMPLTVDNPAIGRVVEVADPKSLATALSQLLSAPQELAGMGQAARERVLERFSQTWFDSVGATSVRRLEDLLSQR
ncbi:glycosyltransferase family 4 protein [Croceicoccus sp. F390]|uniref:Glycosyltransferase family 4 protein n=1 Tax=Croceicoccus esteveae TaxID=3075597 RepID=A0ABU2ZIX4_9SPHN|nr:glycosyltransferase family 4 protein [Croceicoccus sp. F390]MDT0576562.1 glycosyltransferase family 4 protein [Croceicoccus sp. F390]